MGALLLGAQVRLTPTVEILAELPAAFLRGHTNGCVDAYCETSISALVVGNPLLGVRYTAVPDRLWIQAAYRLSLMDLDPWEAGVNTWQRMIDGYTANAALAAAEVSRRDAVMPHTSSIGLGVLAQTELQDGIHLWRSNWPISGSEAPARSVSVATV